MLKNKLLVTFAAITFVGLGIYYLDIKWIWNLYSALDTASAVALSVLAFFGYMEYSKSEDKIRIYFLVDDEKTLDTELSVLRKNCTRSELFGILGMIQKNPKNRYDIQYMRDKSLLQKLQDIQKGDLDKFIIPITTTELAQFELNYKRD